MVTKKILLVVEDEPLQRLTAMDMIEDAGFEVIAAADATEAIAILESRPDISLVFTDIDMPRGVNGKELAALIRDRWPPIHVIVTSGCQDGEKVELPDGTLFFAKPYREHEVIAAMRRLAA